MGQKQSILRRIMGDPISDSTEAAIPGIRGAWMGSIREVFGFE